jgi:predicted secreted protein
MRRGSNSRTPDPRARARRARQLAALAGLAAVACVAALAMQSTLAQAAPTCESYPTINPGTDIYEFDDVTSSSVTLTGHILAGSTASSVDGSLHYFDTDWAFVVYDHTNTEVARGPLQTLVGSPTDTEVEQTISGLTPGERYYFAIDASNFCGQTVPPSPQVTPNNYWTFRTLSRVDAVIDGEGSVSRSGGSLTCTGTTCTTDFDSFSSSVTLNASPDSGVLFLGWTGACETTSTTCVISDLGLSTATAHFGWNPLLNVSMAGPGSGRVTSSPGGISCASGNPTGCSASFGLGSTVTLTAVPDAGSMFIGWGSDETSCSSSAPVCTKKLSTSTYVTAIFAPASELVVSVDSGSGSGTVTSVPAGITCPGICNAYFPNGTEVELTATAKPGSTFVGWDGVCFDRSPLAPCSFVMTGDTELNAEFSNPLVELAGGGAIVRVNQTRNGKTIRVHRGDLLLLSLPAKKSTGFGWHLRTLDRKALKLLSSGYVESTAASTPALGDPGSYTLRLKALKKSKTAITLSYSRGGGKAVRTFKLRIVVR